MENGSHKIDICAPDQNSLAGSDVESIIWQSLFLPEQAFEHAKRKARHIREVLNEHKIEYYSVWAGFNESHLHGFIGINPWEEILIRIDATNPIDNISPELLKLLGQEIFSPFAGAVCIGDSDPIKAPVCTSPLHRTADGIGFLNFLHQPGPVVVAGSRRDESDMVDRKCPGLMGEEPQSFEHDANVQGETCINERRTEHVEVKDKMFQKLHISTEAYIVGEENGYDKASNLGTFSLSTELLWWVEASNSPRGERAFVELSYVKFEHVPSVNATMWQYNQTATSVTLNCMHKYAWFNFKQRRPFYYSPSQKTCNWLYFPDPKNSLNNRTIIQGYELPQVRFDFLDLPETPTFYELELTSRWSSKGGVENNEAFYSNLCHRILFCIPYRLPESMCDVTKAYFWKHQVNGGCGVEFGSAQVTTSIAEDSNN